jgi:hypothetical protein
MLNTFNKLNTKIDSLTIDSEGKKQEASTLNQNYIDKLKII